VPQKAAPKRRFRSAEGRSEAAGEATDLIAFAFALVFFLQFRPKIACQAPKPPKSLKKQELALAF
jgi:hypothetical protein